MDNVSLRTMEQLVRTYFVHDTGTTLRVLDVGSMNVQVGEYDSYRKFFPAPRFDYVGLDLDEGSNVDFVPPEPYNWGLTEEFDLVISGQCFEHVEFPWLTMEQIEKAMKPGALHFNILPSQGPIHRFPMDYWRFLPDSAIALSNWVGLEVVEIQSRKDSIWANTVLVARKPN